MAVARVRVDDGREQMTGWLKMGGLHQSWTGVRMGVGLLRRTSASQQPAPAPAPLRRALLLGGLAKPASAGLAALLPATAAGAGGRLVAGGWLAAGGRGGQGAGQLEGVAALVRGGVVPKLGGGGGQAGLAAGQRAVAGRAACGRGGRVQRGPVVWEAGACAALTAACCRWGTRAAGPAPSARHTRAHPCSGRWSTAGRPSPGPAPGRSPPGSGCSAGRWRRRSGGRRSARSWPRRTCVPDGRVGGCGSGRAHRQEGRKRPGRRYAFIAALPLSTPTPTSGQNPLGPHLTQAPPADSP